MHPMEACAIGGKLGKSLRRKGVLLYQIVEVDVILDQRLSRAMIGFWTGEGGIFCVLRSHCACG